MPAFNFKIDVLPPDSDTPLLSGVWASVEDLSGRRLEQAQATNAETTHLFRVWYNAMIVSDCRISYAGALYLITYIVDRGKPVRNVYLDLYAQRVREGK